jgi:PTH1 family peptidyl-tRNA hydrolase
LLPNDDRRFLVVGLGNPGKQYVETRHNIGFLAVDLFAKQNGLVFSKKNRFKAKCAEGTFIVGKVFVIKPTTYMNLSGDSVYRVMRYYRIEIRSLLIVVDDVYLPFGALRVKSRGSSGGHNGLKSVAQSLATQEYARLRIGIGTPVDSDMASYVLEPFGREEKEQLPRVLSSAVNAIERVLTDGLVQAMNVVNVHPNI